MRGGGMLLSPHALKSPNSIGKIRPKMMCATFNGNPCNSPINAKDETVITALKRVRQNDLWRHKDSNRQIWKWLFLHNLPKRNGEFLKEFSLENNLSAQDTKLQKMERKLRTYNYPNDTKSQLCYILLNKWMTSVLNSKYSIFDGVYSDHRIVTLLIRLSLYMNKKEPKYHSRKEI